MFKKWTVVFNYLEVDLFVMHLLLKTYFGGIYPVYFFNKRLENSVLPLTNS